ncbi:hypothetical protein ACH5RR_037934 [Cinchona calisaya]|uniref:tRNA-uridine aminocarboxypropyltransferase n=1 Tax=Cinchona calisaya TaxID=153742 RepID=A0ABD2YCC4_9GENT
MVTESGSSKRPMCPNCSKPAKICLCTRLNTPILENSVAVTILQHSLEMKHPLNSTRIASLGLRNLSVVSVSDVNFQARFVLDVNYPDSKTGSGHLVGNGKRKWDCVQGTILCNGWEESSDFVKFLERTGEKRPDIADSEVTFIIEKYGLIMQKKNSFDQILASGNDSEKGFGIIKYQRKKLDEKTDEYEEFQEFGIRIPPGSVLLFPSEKAVGIEEIEDFEVKNLIVLDGTWAKAKRMYNENPWLKLLPHLKLDLEKLSLYSEVRHQPKAGCLSTIESIVYALKALGEEDSEKLDGLLEVFKSMVGDQRRCKDERLSKVSVNSSQS